MVIKIMMQKLTKNYWIVGKHAVKAALNNTQREKIRLCLAKDIIFKHNNKNLKPEIISREQISKIVGSSVSHQGIALNVKPLIKRNIIEFLKKTKKNKNIIIILDQITDVQNIGAIMRSAQAFSASAIICQEKNSPRENTLLSRAAAGALEFIPLIYVKNIAQTIQLLKENDFWSIGLNGKSKHSLKDISKINNSFFDSNIALVMGSEGKGIRNLVTNNCDICCKIDIKDTIDSLNVSVALAIALYEITRSQKF